MSKTMKIILTCSSLLPALVNAWGASLSPFSVAKSTRNGPPAFAYGNKKSSLTKLNLWGEFRDIPSSPLYGKGYKMDPEERIHARGSIATIQYTAVPVEFEPDLVYDMNTTITFTLSQGNYLPAMHQLVSTMKVGETREKVIMDAGFGERQTDFVGTLPRNEMQLKDDKELKVGMVSYASTGHKCIITMVNETHFTADANPKMAGCYFYVDVTLLKIEPGPYSFPTDFILPEPTQESRYEIATFALGCFWGPELALMRLPGVVGTTVGYSQGTKKYPIYSEVAKTNTNHTEVVLVTFDPKIVTYKELVEWAMNYLGDNKYLVDQVGDDQGHHYRHGIYYHNEEQYKIAKPIVESFGPQCVTEFGPAATFWKAEGYQHKFLLKGGQSARKNDQTEIALYG